MRRFVLADARVRALRPRKTAYDVRDGQLRGFGVRVLPSGRKPFFVHCQHRGERVWKIVGDAGTMELRQARSLAVAMLTAIRRGEDTPCHPEETLFDAVADTVFQHYERVWKARTLYVNRSYLRNQILPRFAGRPIADIDRQEVRNWFASLRATPVAADRSMPVLSVVMREAEAMGLRPEGSNPCRGIRRYRRHPPRAWRGVRGDQTVSPLSNLGKAIRRLALLHPRPAQRRRGRDGGRRQADKSQDSNFIHKKIVLCVKRSYSA